MFTHTYTKFDTNVYSSIFYSHQELKTAQAFFNRRMNKQTVEYSYNEVLLRSQNQI